MGIQQKSSNAKPRPRGSVMRRAKDPLLPEMQQRSCVRRQSTADDSLDPALFGNGRRAGRTRAAKTEPRRSRANPSDGSKKTDTPAALAVDADFHQVMERAWLIMAIIGVALSDHPLVRENRASRHLADRARKALFDLHARLDTRREGRH